jgi:hypothetical protein
MNQKLSNWASIAEIVAAIGVIVTLIFLIVGIRENTEITRVTAFDRNMESVNQWRMELAKDPELARIWRSREDLAALSENDQLRLVMLHGSLWGIYEKSYYAMEYGLLGQAEWNRFETQMCAQINSMNLESWSRMTGALTRQFVSYAEGLCAIPR